VPATCPAGRATAASHGHSRTVRRGVRRSENQQVASQQRRRLPKLTVQLGEMGLAAEGMRVEMWGWPPPNPAVGVFTPAGTCPGRLRQHCVIGCADPGQNPPAVRSGSSRVRGRGLGRQWRGRCPGAGPAAVMTGAPRPGVGHDGRRRVARQGQAAWQSLGDSGHGAARPGMAATNGRGGARETSRSIASSVNRFVNRTRRDNMRRGRRCRRRETGSVPSAEVSAPVRDGPRRGRRSSYGS
jgi:hypothetical protein